MEELKLLVGMVATLPTMALWVLCGYLVYKLAVIGSIYGVIRFAVDKLHSAYTWKRDGIATDLRKLRCIDVDVEQALIAQLRRISSTSYIHASDVYELTKAIDSFKGTNP